MSHEKPVVLDMKAGQELKITFAAVAMPYSWKPKGDDAVFVHEKTIPGKGIGAGVTTEFTLLAHNVGTYKLRFELRRPWEDAPAEVKSYVLNVKP